MEDDDVDLMPQVFVVDEEVDEFNLDLPPTSGQVYLRRVQWVILSLSDNGVPYPYVLCVVSING